MHVFDLHMARIKFRTGKSDPSSKHSDHGQSTRKAFNFGNNAWFLHVCVCKKYSIALIYMKLICDIIDN